jgi:hypothetical protein
VEISKDTLVRIIRETKCDWTRGYVSCLLDVEAPTRNEIARELIEAEGPQRKIHAIKSIRSNFDISLKQAKRMVDEYYASGQIIFPEDDPNNDCFAGAQV